MLLITVLLWIYVIVYKIQIYTREDSSTELGIATMKASETKRQSDAKAVQRAFSMNKKVQIFSDSGSCDIFIVHYFTLIMILSIKV